jgi:hypothetical protein
MTLMTTTEEAKVASELLKMDVLGRVKVKAEHREAMLDAFEASGMSGQAFAIHHGIKVQTFASWMQKRRHSRGDYDDEQIRQKLRMRSTTIKPPAPSPAASPPGSFNLIEVQLRRDADAGDTNHANQTVPPIEITLPGGALVKITCGQQIPLLKSLLRALPC